MTVISLVAVAFVVLAMVIGLPTRPTRTAARIPQSQPHGDSHKCSEGSIEGEWVMRRISRRISGDEFAGAAIDGTARFNEGGYELSWKYLVSGAEAHESGTYTLVPDCLITFTAPEGTANLTGGHTMSYSFTPHDQGESALLDLRADGALLLRIALTRGR